MDVDNLCDSLATLIRRLRAMYVNPIGISSLVVDQLIALNKCPAVQPIGVVDICHHVISKAIFTGH